MIQYLYRCTSQGPTNNGLKPHCQFEYKLDEGTHHCPLCGHPLAIVSEGPSVSEVLRRGQLSALKK